MKDTKNTDNRAYMDRATLRVRQAMPLEAKVVMSQTRIRAWIVHWGYENVSVSYSGGKDSTVLLHLVRSVAPNTPAVFANTGLEYPEILEQVRATENVMWVRPKMTFQEVIEKHGWPVVSRRMSQYVKEVRSAKGDTATKILRLTGVHPSGKKSPMSKISACWLHLCDAPFKVSDRCCDIIKKNPLDSIGTHPFVGTMAQNGAQREISYIQNGCNMYDAKHPISRPMSFWTEADVWEYIKSRGMRYSRIYDMGYKRTGCMFCPFGLHMEGKPNRFDLMKQTHPKLHRFIMDEMGLRDVLQFVYRDKPDVIADELF